MKRLSLALLTSTLCAVMLVDTVRAQCETPGRSPFQDALLSLVPDATSFDAAISGAKEGDANELYNLAFMSAKGDVLPKDGQVAFDLLSMSAKAGNANASFIIHLLEVEKAIADTIPHFGRDCPAPRLHLNINNFSSYQLPPIFNAFQCISQLDIADFSLTNDTVCALLRNIFADDEKRGVSAAKMALEKLEHDIGVFRKIAKENELFEETLRIQAANAQVLHDELGIEILSRDQKRDKNRGMRKQALKRVALPSRRPRDAE